MFSNQSAVFRALLAGAALTACGQGDQTQGGEAPPSLETQEQGLQCHVSSRSLGEIPGTQRLMECGAQAGWALHGGDVNGDGFSDLLVGAPGDLSNRGSACLVLGNSLMDLANVHSKLSGPDLSAKAGHVVALGDFAGTGGKLDLLVGGPGYNMSRGVVYAVDGMKLPSVPSSEVVRYLGAASTDEAGTALAVGDVTGDGAADLVVGSPFNESGGAPSNSGIVYIVKNTGALPANTNLFINTVPRIQNVTTTIAQTDLRAGTSLAIADVNGDGTKDLFVGVPGYDGTPGADTGAVFVFYGPLTANKLLTNADLKLVGASAGERAGTSVARVGDLNGDGKEDVLIGAPGSGTASGKAYLVHGGLPSGIISLNSTIAFTGTSGDRAGTSVAAGDFNADGVPDMLIGAPGHQSSAGAVFLIHGDEPLLPTQGLEGFTTFEGENPGDKAGHAVASAGDFDGDGVEDIVVGAPYGNGGQGLVYLVRGEAPRNWYEDTDGDGFGAKAGAPVLDCVPPAGQWVLNNLDCNDADVSINPDALELCSTNGIDDNCNDLVDEQGATDAPFWAKDLDQDEYADAFEPLVQACVSPGMGWINNDDLLGYECPDPESDNDRNTHENAQEVCDEKDNNCNGEVDDGNAGIWYADVDGDGYGSDAEFFPYAAPCGAKPKPGYVNNKDDCNDRDKSVHPKTRWYEDGDGDGIGNNTSPYKESCTKPAGPYVRRNDDCNDADNTVSPVLAEVCEPELSPQKDNNCNGNPNDTLAAITWFKDLDGDGYGDEVILGRFCGKPANSSKVTGDCEDDVAEHGDKRFPGNPEVCEVVPGDRYAHTEQIDNDCDGDVNDTPEAIWWHGDGDRDDLAGTVFKLNRCTNPSDQPGEVQGKYLPNQNPVDCNDSDATATVVRNWYEDKDGDGCGNPNVAVSSCYAPSCGTPYATTSGPNCT